MDYQPKVVRFRHPDLILFLYEMEAGAVWNAPDGGKEGNFASFIIEGGVTSCINTTTGENFAAGDLGGSRRMWMGVDPGEHEITAGPGGVKWACVVPRKPAGVLVEDFDPYGSIVVPDGHIIMALTGTLTAGDESGDAATGAVFGPWPEVVVAEADGLVLIAGPVS